MAAKEHKEAQKKTGELKPRKARKTRKMNTGRDARFHGRRDGRRYRNAATLVEARWDVRDAIGNSR